MKLATLVHGPSFCNNKNKNVCTYSIISDFAINTTKTIVQKKDTA